MFPAPSPLVPPRDLFTLRHDGLAAVVAGSIRLESARRGLSQRDLAALTHISPTAVSRRINGATPWRLDEIGDLALAFGCRVRDLVEPPAHSRVRF